MTHVLPALPYAAEALEPHIDAQTMQIHHGKHHQAYVTNLNAAIEKAPELATWSLDDLNRRLSEVPEAVRTAVRNNGGGHWNHSLFWRLMAPHAGGDHKPLRRLAITEFLRQVLIQPLARKGELLLAIEAHDAKCMANVPLFLTY